MSVLSRKRQSLFLSHLLTTLAADPDATARLRSAEVFVPKLEAALTAFRTAQAEGAASARAARLVASPNVDGQSVLATVRQACKGLRLAANALSMSGSPAGAVATAATSAAVAETLAGLAARLTGVPLVDVASDAGVLGAQLDAIEATAAALESSAVAFVREQVATTRTAVARAVAHQAARAELESRATEGPAISVATLSATSRLITRFRDAVRLELELDAGLPRDLEVRLFGFLDALNDEARQQRARQAHRGHAPEAAPPAAEAASAARAA